MAHDLREKALSFCICCHWLHVQLFDSLALRGIQIFGQILKEYLMSLSEVLDLGLSRQVARPLQQNCSNITELESEVKLGTCSFKSILESYAKLRSLSKL